MKDNITKNIPTYQNSIDLFINIEDKLVNFDFDKYSIKSFKVLDDLKDAKLLDYSLDIS